MLSLRSTTPPTSSPAARAIAPLTWLIALLAAIVSAKGLFTGGGPGPFTFTSVHGQSVPMYGQGLYQNDSLLIGSGFRGVDAVVLFVGLPLLLAALAAFRRNSLRGHLVLTGTLAFFLYQYASMAFGAAFNPFFPAYIALFSLSLFAFVISFATVDLARLERSASPRMPVRGIAVFLFVVLAVLLVVWGSELVGNVVDGKVSARIDNYTTVITDVLDLGVILPATAIGGVIVRRRTGFGYLLAATVLVVCVFMGPALTALTVAQLAAGVSFTPGEVVGPIVGFSAVAILGMLVAAVMLRHVVDGPVARTAPQPAPSAA